MLRKRWWESGLRVFSALWCPEASHWIHVQTSREVVVSTDSRETEVASKFPKSYFSVSDSMLEVLGTAKPMQNTAEPLQAGCYMKRFEYACVPQPCMFEHMSPADSTGLVGCGSFQIQVLDGRSKVLGACLAGYTPVLLPTLFWSARLSELSILSCRQPRKPSFPWGCNYETRSQANPFPLGSLLCHSVEEHHRYTGQQTGAVML